MLRLGFKNAMKPIATKKVSMAITARLVISIVRATWRSIDGT